MSSETDKIKPTSAPDFILNDIGTDMKFTPDDMLANDTNIESYNLQPLDFYKTNEVARERLASKNIDVDSAEFEEYYNKRAKPNYDYVKQGRVDFENITTAVVFDSAISHLFGGPSPLANYSRKSTLEESGLKKELTMKEIGMLNGVDLGNGLKDFTKTDSAWDVITGDVNLKLSSKLDEDNNFSFNTDKDGFYYMQEYDTNERLLTSDQMVTAWNSGFFKDTWFDGNKVDENVLATAFRKSPQIAALAVGLMGTAVAAPVVAGVSAIAALGFFMNSADGITELIRSTNKAIGGEKEDPKWMSRFQNYLQKYQLDMTYDQMNNPVGVKSIVANSLDLVGQIKGMGLVAKHGSKGITSLQKALNVVPNNVKNVNIASTLGLFMMSAASTKDFPRIAREKGIEEDHIPWMHFALTGVIAFTGKLSDSLWKPLTNEIKQRAATNAILQTVENSSLTQLKNLHPGSEAALSFINSVVTSTRKIASKLSKNSLKKVVPKAAKKGSNPAVGVGAGAVMEGSEEVAELAWEELIKSGYNLTYGAGKEAGKGRFDDLNFHHVLREGAISFLYGGIAGGAMATNIGKTAMGMQANADEAALDIQQYALRGAAGKKEFQKIRDIITEKKYSSKLSFAVGEDGNQLPVNPSSSNPLEQVSQSELIGKLLDNQFNYVERLMKYKMAELGQGDDSLEKIEKYFSKVVSAEETKIFEDISLALNKTQEIQAKILEEESNLKEGNATIPAEQIKAVIKSYKEDLKEANKEFQDLVSGEKNNDYMQKAVFNDSNLPITFDRYKELNEELVEIRKLQSDSSKQTEAAVEKNSAALKAIKTPQELREFLSKSPQISLKDEVYISDLLENKEFIKKATPDFIAAFTSHLTDKVDVVREKVMEFLDNSDVSPGYTDELVYNIIANATALVNKDDFDPYAYKEVYNYTGTVHDQNDPDGEKLVDVDIAMRLRDLIPADIFNEFYIGTKHVVQKTLSSLSRDTSYKSSDGLLTLPDKRTSILQEIQTELGGETLESIQQELESGRMKYQELEFDEEKTAALLDLIHERIKHISTIANFSPLSYAYEMTDTSLSPLSEKRKKELEKELADAGEDTDKKIAAVEKINAEYQLETSDSLKTLIDSYSKFSAIYDQWIKLSEKSPVAALNASHDSLMDNISQDLIAQTKDKLIDLEDPETSDNAKKAFSYFHDATLEKDHNEKFRLFSLGELFLSKVLNTPNEEAQESIETIILEDVIRTNSKNLKNEDGGSVATPLIAYLNAINSSANEATISKLSEIYEDMESTPTYEQIYAARQMYSHLSDTENRKVTLVTRALDRVVKAEHRDVFLLQGIYGSGKSSYGVTTGLKLFNEDLKKQGKEHKTIATAPYIDQQKNIHDQLTSSGIEVSNDRDYLISTLELSKKLDSSDKIFDGVSSIVIDEATLVSKDHLEELFKSARSYNKGNRSKDGQALIQIVLVGDPSQISYMEKGVEKSVNQLSGINRSSYLTRTQRTNYRSIVTAQDSINRARQSGPGWDGDNISAGSSALSFELRTTYGKMAGVDAGIEIVQSSSDKDSTIIKAIAENSDNVVYLTDRIVSEDSEYKRLSSKVGGGKLEEVTRSYVEFQGSEKEVVIIDFKDMNLKANEAEEKVFLTKLQMAIGRAKSKVIIINAETNRNWVSIEATQEKMEGIIKPHHYSEIADSTKDKYSDLIESINENPSSQDDPENDPEEDPEEEPTEDVFVDIANAIAILEGDNDFSKLAQLAKKTIIANEKHLYPEQKIIYEEFLEREKEADGQDGIEIEDLEKSLGDLSELSNLLTDDVKETIEFIEKYERFLDDDLRIEFEELKEKVRLAKVKYSGEQKIIIDHLTTLSNVISDNKSFDLESTVEAYNYLFELNSNKPSKLKQDQQLLMRQFEAAREAFIKSKASTPIEVKLDKTDYPIDYYESSVVDDSGNTVIEFYSHDTNRGKANRKKVALHVDDTNLSKEYLIPNGLKEVTFEVSKVEIDSDGKAVVTGSQYNTDGTIQDGTFTLIKKKPKKEKKPNIAKIEAIAKAKIRLKTKKGELTAKQKEFYAIESNAILIDAKIKELEKTEGGGTTELDYPEGLLDFLIEISAIEDPKNLTDKQKNDIQTLLIKVASKETTKINSNFKNPVGYLNSLFDPKVFTVDEAHKFFEFLIYKKKSDDSLRISSFTDDHRIVLQVKESLEQIKEKKIVDEALLKITIDSKLAEIGKEHYSEQNYHLLNRFYEHIRAYDFVKESFKPYVKPKKKPKKKTTAESSFSNSPINLDFNHSTDNTKIKSLITAVTNGQARGLKGVKFVIDKTAEGKYHIAAIFDNDKSKTKIKYPFAFSTELKGYPVGLEVTSFFLDLMGSKDRLTGVVKETLVGYENGIDIDNFFENMESQGYSVSPTYFIVSGQEYSKSRTDAINDAALNAPNPLDEVIKSKEYKFFGQDYADNHSDNLATGDAFVLVSKNKATLKEHSAQLQNTNYEPGWKPLDVHYVKIQPNKVTFSDFMSLLKTHARGPENNENPLLHTLLFGSNTVDRDSHGNTNQSISGVKKFLIKKLKGLNPINKPKGAYNVEVQRLVEILERTDLGAVKKIPKDFLDAFNSTSKDFQSSFASYMDMNGAGRVFLSIPEINTNRTDINHAINSRVVLTGNFDQNLIPGTISSTFVRYATPQLVLNKDFMDKLNTRALVSEGGKKKTKKKTKNPTPPTPPTPPTGAVYNTDEELYDAITTLVVKRTQNTKLDRYMQLIDSHLRGNNSFEVDFSIRAVSNVDGFQEGLISTEEFESISELINQEVDHSEYRNILNQLSSNCKL